MLQLTDARRGVWARGGLVCAAEEGRGAKRPRAEEATSARSRVAGPMPPSVTFSANSASRDSRIRCRPGHLASSTKLATFTDSPALVDVAELVAPRRSRWSPPHCPPEAAARGAPLRGLRDDREPRRPRVELGRPTSWAMSGNATADVRSADRGRIASIISCSCPARVTSNARLRSRPTPTRRSRRGCACIPSVAAAGCVTTTRSSCAPPVGPISQKALAKSVLRCTTIAGVPPRLAHRHALRGYYATTLAEERVPIQGSRRDSGTARSRRPRATSPSSGAEFGCHDTIVCPVVTDCSTNVVCGVICRDTFNPISSTASSNARKRFGQRVAVNPAKRGSRVGSSGGRSHQTSRP